MAPPQEPIMPSQSQEHDGEEEQSMLPGGTVGDSNITVKKEPGTETTQPGSSNSTAEQAHVSLPQDPDNENGQKKTKKDKKVKSQKKDKNKKEKAEKKDKDTKTIKLEKPTEKEQGKETKSKHDHASEQAVCAVDAAGTSQPASSAVVGPIAGSASSSKEQQTNKDPEQQGMDITQQFLQEHTTGEEEGRSTKDKFLAGDLLVPGIALKKFKICLDSSGQQSVGFKFALLGAQQITKYRATRKILEGMVLGDTTKMNPELWTKAATHLETRGLTAILVADASAVVLEDVPCLSQVSFAESLL